MKNTKRNILSLIIISNIILFVVITTIFNYSVPRHYTNDALSTLKSEIKYYQEPDATYGDLTTYLSGNISIMPLNAKKKKLKLPKNAGYTRGYANMRVLETKDIEDYLEEHIIKPYKCYTFEGDHGFYVLTLIPQTDDDGKKFKFIEYINVTPFINYAYSLNWIIAALFIGVSIVMGIIGFKLSKRIEDSQESERRFFQNSSHELKTPLMSIQGYAEGIIRGVEKPEESARVILFEGERMTKLVEELLSISKLDSNQLVLKKNTVDIRESIYDCMRVLEPTAIEKEKIMTPLFDHNSVFVSIDDDQMTRALENIIVNGIRHADHEVVIQCHAITGHAIITVEDDGGGINEEDLPHVFERFYTGSKEGTGIGLSLAKDIIELHKGTLKAYNTDKGATFEVDLPLSKL